MFAPFMKSSPQVPILFYDAYKSHFDFSTNPLLRYAILLQFIFQDRLWVSYKLTSQNDENYRLAFPSSNSYSLLTESLSF
jgi:hypothetical protein